MVEIWKKHPDKVYKNYYEISNKGQVRNNKETILKQSIKSGYYYCCFQVGKDKRGIKIHRLVAKLFVKNNDPDKYNVVNHINGNKLDNNYTNLEWCNSAMNGQHALDNNLLTPFTRRIVSANVETNQCEVHDSILQASKDLNIDDGYICKVLSGERDQAKGYCFIYYREDAVPVEKINDFSKFKQLVDFPNYLINNKGEIYSLIQKKIMKVLPHKEGCLQVNLSYNTNRKTYLIHRLVGSYFLKKINAKHNSITHIDRDRTNNNVENLAWTYIPGVIAPPDLHKTHFYNPKNAVKVVQKKENKEPKDLLTANPKYLSKKQRLERKLMLQQNVNI